MLAASGGYINLHQTTATLSLGDVRRGVTEVTVVRGGRPGGTQFLVDGIAVNNPVFGTPPLLVDPLAIAGVTFSPSHYDAENGGGLSGVVEQATRGGSARPTGAVELETTSLAGALGSVTSGAAGSYAVRGLISGPLPIRGTPIRFSLAGHAIGGRSSVRTSANGTWQGVDGTEDDQVVAKLSYAIRPSLLWSALAIGQARVVTGVEPNLPTGDTVATPVARDAGGFFVTRLEKRLSRASVAVSLAANGSDRRTCNVWRGVCVEDRLQRIPQGDEIPAFGPPPRLTPYVVSGQYFGGESYRAHVARADVDLQASDHHQVQVGVYAARYDLSYHDAMGFRWQQGMVLTAIDAYRAHPTEFSTYAQDVMQYDLLTVHFGVRFDYANMGGMAFVNPLDPTNGTTAREVCEGTARGLNSTPFTYGDQRGLVACIMSPPDASGRPILLDSATRLAQQDDFHAVRPRAAFSPRIGVSLPLTEQSVLYFNYGRYNKNPAYHDAYRNTGTGSHAGFGAGTDGMCSADHARYGSSECIPDLALDPTVPEFVGNPDMMFEKSNALEAGFATQVGRLHALDAVVFRNEQSYLPSVYTGALTPDIGLTYRAQGQTTERTVLSNGSLSSLGVSVTWRRHLEAAFSYSLNYTWEHSTEIGALPDLVAEALAAGQVFDNTAERVSGLNRTHTFNAVITWQGRDETPAALGTLGKMLLRNARLVTSISASSGSNEPDRSACSPMFPCPPLARDVAGTGTLINLLYMRPLTTRGVRCGLVARVLNVLDANDGSTDLLTLARQVGTPTGAHIPPQSVSTRRILAGFNIEF